MKPWRDYREAQVPSMGTVQGLSVVVTSSASCTLLEVLSQCQCTVWSCCVLRTPYFILSSSSSGRKHGVDDKWRKEGREGARADGPNFAIGANPEPPSRLPGSLRFLPSRFPHPRLLSTVIGPLPRPGATSGHRTSSTSSSLRRSFSVCRGA